MKSLRTLAIAVAMAISSLTAANAQIYSIVNQTTSMLQTIFNGGFRYRGFVDGSVMRGIGDKKADIYEITTTQGVKYADWFFMGLGAGVDIISAQQKDVEWANGHPETSMRTTGVMVPLYTDFRFNIGSAESAGFFIDCRIGASFLMGKSKLQIGEGYINRNECFYLKPTIGARIPVSSSDSRKAINIGASYQLVTTQYWSSYSADVSLNSFGVTIGFEW